MHRRFRLIACTAVAIATLGLPNAGAQSVPAAQRDVMPHAAPTQGRIVQPPRDSTAILRAARAEQATFERVRRRQLPRRFSPTPTRCDETIGRFCYWDDDSREDELVRSPTPPEARRTIDARARLLEHLDSASTILPGDEWITGIHVHYLLEAGQLERAGERAARCTSSEWWCTALTGLVSHAAWRYADADSLFARALATMPDAERCEWLDLQELLAAEQRERYRRASCAERPELNDRIWWLADPLFTREGNDRRTEHYARRVRARAHRGAASAYGMRWADDLEEIVRRYGWPSHYMQSIPDVGRMEQPGISSYHESPSYHFLPDPNVADETRTISDSTWTLRPRATRERYAPPYGTFAALSHLASLFRRGDSVLLIVAYDARGDSMLESQPITSALIASSRPDAPTNYAMVRHATSARGTLMLTIPDTALLASVEILAGPRIRRARFGVGFPDVPKHPFRMSDIALFDAGAEPPADLDALLPLALASDSVRVGGKVGLFWEVYGNGASADQATIGVEIVREGSGWLRRAGERVGLVGPPARAQFAWRESSTGTSIASRAVVVDVKALDPGRYRIEVTITPDGLAPVVAQRRIEIVR